MANNKKRCHLKYNFYKELESFVSKQTQQPSHHQISYWINIVFRLGVVCIDNKIVNMNELMLLNMNEEEGEIYVVSIEAHIYDDLKAFITRCGHQPKLHVTNFWLNLACKAGLGAILEQRINLTNYFLGLDSSQWFIKRDNLIVLPVEQPAEIVKQPCPQLSQPSHNPTEKRAEKPQTKDLSAHMRLLDMYN